MQFTGFHERTLFESADGFMVALYTDPATNETKKLVGYSLPDKRKVKYQFEATEEDDAKYGGKKYNVTHFEIAPCGNKEEVIDLLSSGLFKGIGPATAKRIYEKYGDDAARIVREEPERLISIKGFSHKTIVKIKECNKANISETKVYELLSPYGFSIKQVHHICTRLYKTEPVSCIKAAPYVLCDIRGVTFDAVDAFANTLGVKKDSEDRIYAAAKEIISQIMLRGHVAARYEELSRELIKKLKTDLVDASSVGKHILSLLKNERLSYRKVKDGEDIKFLIYLPYAKDAEDTLTSKLLKTVERKYSKKRNLDVLIHAEEMRTGIRLDQLQTEAVKMALNNSLSIITGGPGTGKTTILKMVAKLWEELHPEMGIELLSPTGRAARRMTESTGYPASTIHSRLKLDIEEDREVNENGRYPETIENSLVIIDESSMLDLFLARDLLVRLTDCSLLFVGDVDQLPSVGAGKVLSDMINSGQIPVTKLKYTHRQAEGSTICSNADKVKNGVNSLSTSDEFRIYMLPENNILSYDDILTRMEDKMVSLYVEDAKKCGRKNVVVLCPYNKHPGGQISMNIRLQRIFNPPDPSGGSLEY